jgi:hypothetical protein
MLAKRQEEDEAKRLDDEHDYCIVDFPMWHQVMMVTQEGSKAGGRMFLAEHDSASKSDSKDIGSDTSISEQRGSDLDKDASSSDHGVSCSVDDLSKGITTDLILTSSDKLSEELIRSFVVGLHLRDYPPVKLIQLPVVNVSIVIAVQIIDETLNFLVCKR